MAGIDIPFFSSTIAAKAMDNWSKPKAAFITSRKDKAPLADLIVVCVFCGVGLALALLFAAFVDVAALARALAIAG